MNNNQSSAWYALRRTITPWFADRNIAELVNFCKENFVDEVIAKVDTEEFSHGIPTLEWLEGYMPILKKLKQELANIQVFFSINPWVTLVHCDRGRDIRQTHPDVGLMVGHKGEQCLACACPLSAGWRDITGKLWGLYASLEPEVLWVEDDIRLLNHQPAEYGCFCELHLKAFSQRMGKQVSRQELVDALLKPGKPHPYRKEWLDMNRDIMIDVAGFLEKTVHKISPNTKLGLMCNMPNDHALEGRDWKSFASALSGSTKFVARPCMLSYPEISLKNLYVSEWMLRQTANCLDSDVIIQTEVENWPFSIYSKSATFTFLQMALSFALGADGVTLNLFDHLGSPMADTPEFGLMLKKSKPFLNALAQRCRGTAPAGIGLINAQNGAYFTQSKDGSDWRQLLPESQGFRQILEPLGFAYTFNESSVVAISGQGIRSFSEQSVQKLLSKGVLLDLTAAQCLIEMGYGAYIGADIKRTFSKNTEPLAAEEYYHPEFGGQDRKYITLTLPHLAGNPLLGQIVPSKDAQVISWVVDMDAIRRYPFLTIYKNQLGGRVAIYPIDIEKDFGVPLLHPYRKQQFEQLLKWLSKETVPLMVSGGAYPLSFRNDAKDYSIIGVFNLSQDAWENVEIEMNIGSRSISTIELLKPDGRWSSSSLIAYAVDGNDVKITLNDSLMPASMAVFTVFWKNES